MKPSQALLVLGLSPTGLYVIREAAACGATVLGYSDTRDCGASSVHLSNSKALLEAGAGPLRDCLINTASRFDRLAVIPTTDRHVEWLIEALPSLPENVFCAASYRQHHARKLLLKDEVTSAAKAAGIAVPAERSAAGFQPQIESFPFIVKPLSIHLERDWLQGKKLFFCASQSDWERVRSQPRFRPENWTIQGLVHGPESNIQVAAVTRNARGGTTIFCGRKLRQYPINFGSASLLIAENDQEVREKALALLEQLDFRGIAGVEFKRDSRDGSLNFIEMNPRPSLWFAAATAHGEFLVREQLAEWWGQDVPAPRIDTTNKVVWRYAVKDLLSALQHRKSVSNSEIPPPDTSRGSGGTNCWAVHDRADPAPARAELLNYARKAVQRLTS